MNKSKSVIAKENDEIYKQQVEAAKNDKLELLEQLVKGENMDVQDEVVQLVRKQTIPEIDDEPMEPQDDQDGITKLCNVLNRAQK